MLFALALALVGYWIGGLRGALLGGFVGYLLGRAAQSAVRRRLQGVGEQFLEAAFSVMGAVCKADGVVTRDEIRVTEEVFVRLGLTPEQRQSAQAAFTRGKGSDFDVDAAVDSFVRATGGGRAIFPLFLQLQLLAVAADGQVHPAEHALLLRVATRLGLTDDDLARLEALLRAVAAGDASPGGESASSSRLDDAYAALGVAPTASEADIKRAYRKLMSENHPDKLAAQGLPAAMRSLAEQRAREINVAYDLVKRARRFG